MNYGADDPTVSLVGPGRAGTTVALALMANGYRVVAVAGRAPDAVSTMSTAAVCDAQARLVGDIGIGAKLVVIATPDHAIETVPSVFTSSISFSKSTRWSCICRA